MSAAELVMLSVLGALLGLDVVSFPQAMFSRPLVAATAAGAALGNPALGLTAGAVLELIALDTLPVGASRYPEWGSASVVGGALFATFGNAPAGALVLAVTGALATAWAGGWTMFALRQLNGQWARRALPALDAGSPHAVMGLQMLGMTADLIRGGLLTLVALLVLVPVAARLVLHWHAGDLVSHMMVVACAVAVAISAMWKLVHGATHAKWFALAGLLVGLIAVRSR